MCFTNEDSIFEFVVHMMSAVVILVVQKSECIGRFRTLNSVRDKQQLKNYTT